MRITLIRNELKWPASALSDDNTYAVIFKFFFSGQFTIPFECLQPGYRHLQLRSIFDEPLENATLFVHIAVSDADLAPGTPGSATPSTAVNPPKGGSGKRPNLQKRARKSRGRKESDACQLLDVNKPELDEIFASAAEPVQLASTLRETQRWSLAAFRESCGVSALASIKQCVRALAHRCRSDAPAFESSPSYKSKQKVLSSVDSEQTEDQSKARRRVASNDGGTMPLRRQPSDASQSSSSDAGLAGYAKLSKSDRKIALHLRGSLANSDSWKRTQSALDALIDDCLAVLDRAVECCEQLERTYDTIVKFSSVSL